MRFIHWRLLLAATLVTAALVAAVGTTGAQAPPPQQTTVQQEAPKPLRNGCSKLYSQHYHRAYASRVYHRAHISRRATKKLKRLRVCARSAKAGRNMRHVEARLRRARVMRLEMAAVTPYGPCGQGIPGRWAVPCDIIIGEAHGGWGVVNKKGCLGPYQFCGWKVPWPVRTAADKLAHHRMASHLWRGGDGCSNWEQTSNQC